MKINDYKKIFDKTDTTNEMDFRILSSILEDNYNKSKRLIIGKKTFVAIVICCVLSIPISVGAKKVINYFEGIFGKESLEYAVDVVFSDETEHGIMQVEQAISDGKNAYLIFSYELLDKRAREWYENYFLEYGLENNICIQPRIKDDNYKEYGVNWGYGVYNAKDAGIEEFETKSKKYFMVTFHADSDKYGTDQIRFQYLLPGKGYHRTIDIDIKKKVPQTVYELDYRKCEGESYVPTRVSISTFGISIEGVDLGIESTNDEKAKELNSLLLITNDNKWIDLLNMKNLSGGYWGINKYNTVVNDDEVDCQIYNACLRENIDVDSIVGISINAERYYFK